MDDLINARRPWLSAFAAINAFGAWFGAVGLVAGTLDFGERLNDRVPFGNLVLAGLALALSVAIPLTLLAWSAWTGAPRTTELAFVVGALLIGWIVVQICFLRAFSFFHPTYLAIGAGFVVASRRVRLGARRQGALLVATGAIGVAIGVGLLPHLIKNGLTVIAGFSLVFLLGGFSIVGRGVWAAVSTQGRVGKVLVVMATVVSLAIAASIISPAVAATNVPRTAVTTTPDALGLEFESATLMTTDDVELAAWYLPGTNRGGIVVVHGAGSTRSSVLDQAAVLVDNGYSVVLIDARGHGDSDGTAMDFGWYGDWDITAGVEFLASRAEVDPDRIGIVGFSMGGEEAIGAAAADPRIRAVVAEGATARQAADKDWLSDAFGWRGWLQEQIEKVQYGITDYLSEASPPTALRSAVRAAASTRFLLITAGKVDDERRAASYIRSGASERVTVWTVDGADHTGGYDTQPEEWTQQVIAFLDEALNLRR